MIVKTAINDQYIEVIISKKFKPKKGIFFKFKETFLHLSQLFHFSASVLAKKRIERRKAK